MANSNDTGREPMSDARLAEIRERLANWPRSYWLAGEKKASLMQNGEEVRREIAFLSADHSATIDLLTHAYADMQALLADNERLRAREASLVAQNEQAMKIVMALDVLGWDAFIGRELWGQARALLAASTDATTAE